MLNLFNIWLNIITLNWGIYFFFFFKFIFCPRSFIENMLFFIFDALSLKCYAQKTKLLPILCTIVNTVFIFKAPIKHIFCTYTRLNISWHKWNIFICYMSVMVYTYLLSLKVSFSFYLFFYFRYFNSGIKLLEGMRSYFEGLADELQKV